MPLLFQLRSKIRRIFPVWLGEILKPFRDTGPWVKCPTEFSDPTSPGFLLYYYDQPCVVQKWQEVILLSAHIMFAEPCKTVAWVSMSEPPYWQNRGFTGQNEEKWIRSSDGRSGERKKIPCLEHTHELGTLEKHHVQWILKHKVHQSPNDEKTNIRAYNNRVMYTMCCNVCMHSDSRWNHSMLTTWEAWFLEWSQHSGEEGRGQSKKSSQDPAKVLPPKEDRLAGSSLTLLVHVGSPSPRFLFLCYWFSFDPELSLGCHLL